MSGKVALATPDRRLRRSVIFTNAGKVERAMEEASKCAEESEYIVVSERMEKTEELMRIRRRRAR